mgnify:CR=1 FL=1
MNIDALIELTKNITKKSCPDNINFHCHTTFSDGSLKPDELLDQAFRNNLKYLSITDHHTVAAHVHIKENKLMDKYPLNSLNLITGIEINCLLKGCLVHVIGLGIDIYNKSLIPYIQGESPIGNDLQAKSVCQAIKEAGGISFLAHPARYRLPYNILIKEAQSIGINGIEVWYDYKLNDVWEPSLFICEKIDLLANKYKLLKSCGTDSHGYSLLGR